MYSISHCACSGCTLIQPAKDASLWLRILVTIVNIAITPFLLIYHSVESYVVPCVYAFSWSCCIRLLSCNESCFQCLIYTDHSFKPDNTSLGNLQSRPTGVKWVRVSDLAKLHGGKDAKPVLFDDTITATDVCQGALGDCWLLAAFATLCEHKTFIQNCFLTRCYNPRGKYRVRLFDQNTKGFYVVVIDDFIPCDSHSRPLFTQFNGQEIWPLLLEKAYAKSKGSYAAIEGGHPLAAMIDLTGYLGESVVGPFNDAIFKKLQRCSNKGCLLAAGSKGTDNTRIKGRGAVKGSIVGGHAYSILKIHTPMLTTQNIRLLKIRNPWGGFEWDGDWSDNSPLWQKHTGVALEIGKPEQKEDGIFYIQWEDFVRLFGSVDVLYPGFGMDNIHYRVVEKDPICGACRGCVWGCCKYWICLKGLRTLWLAHSSAQMKDTIDHPEEQSMLSVV